MSAIVAYEPHDLAVVLLDHCAGLQGEVCPVLSYDAGRLRGLSSESLRCLVLLSTGRGDRFADSRLVNFKMLWRKGSLYVLTMGASPLFSALRPITLFLIVLVFINLGVISKGLLFLCLIFRFSNFLAFTVLIFIVRVFIVGVFFALLCQ